ncbi:hypothetical protein [Virgibacillus pantothenticus]|uniref:hypothetical protein n=1 Tax=Virgibacillus pantothenticus TaxID=1473 RepID=UPI0009858CFD|nr:hypothetical protein [Virgibacillus pantothenticus]
MRKYLGVLILLLLSPILIILAAIGTILLSAYEFIYSPIYDLAGRPFDSSGGDWWWNNGKSFKVDRCYKIELNDLYKAYFTLADKKLYTMLTVEVVNKYEGNTVIHCRRKCFRWELLVSREKAMAKAQKWLDKHIAIVNKTIGEHGIDAEITLNREEAND